MITTKLEALHALETERDPLTCGTSNHTLRRVVEWLVNVMPDSVKVFGGSSLNPTIEQLLWDMETSKDTDYAKVLPDQLKEVARLARLGQAVENLPEDTAVAKAGPNGDDEGGWWVLRCTYEGWGHWKLCPDAQLAAEGAHGVPKR